jgi:hypothetical protein
MGTVMESRSRLGDERLKGATRVWKWSESDSHAVPFSGSSLSRLALISTN